MEVHTSIISLGRAPLGPIVYDQFHVLIMVDWDTRISLPCSAEVVKIVGRLKRLPKAA